MADPAPLWLAWTAPAIRALPFGRYRVGNAMASLARGPFAARLAPDLGSAVFECDLRDSIAREVCFTGRYEPQETAVAIALLRDGMTVVDVGANWGYFTLVAAHAVGAAGRVIALEPHPRLHAALSRNVRANGFASVACHRLAGGSERRRARFAGFAEADGNSGLSHEVREGEPFDFDSEVAPIDALADSAGVGGVDLVKIDVEGGEADVLKGMARGLLAHRYRYVLLELHPAALALGGTSITSCVSPLARAGYRAWRIDHSAAMHRRAASGRAGLTDFLRRVDPLDIDADEWPHVLWASPAADDPV